jgi:Flp pilus assembly protein CpaB
VVTLMVSPVDAERIALAQAEGQLMLTLRNPLDVEPSETPGVRKAALLSIAAPAPTAARPATARRVVKAEPAPAPVAPPASIVTIYTVETIRAAKRAQETVH